MCGFIAGKDLPVNLESLIETISYRGLPGFKGYQEFSNGIELAHYSLPFTNPDNQVSIQPINYQDNPSLFVGEIFNWEEIKPRVHPGQKEIQFDGDLISYFYQNFGIESFHHFDGFWSFVTIKDDSLLGITDYLSQKPIYYRTDFEVLASEIDILKGIDKVTPDLLFHSNVMKWGYDITGNTPWKEIKQVPPGHFYYRGSVFPYWDWNRIRLQDSLYNDLRNAVKLRLGGFREVPILLSGGLDSTIIYKLLEGLGYHPRAIHVENGESDYLDLVCSNPDLVGLSQVSDLEAIKIHQSPVDLGSVKPQISMSKKLRELGFYSVMTGDGADELFGGYRRSKDYDSQYSDIFCEIPYYHAPRLDRTTMFSTIELRAPFLSPRVIKHALGTNYQERNGEKKRLKQEFGFLIPEEILKRDKLPLKTQEIKISPFLNREKNLKLWEETYING